MPSFQTKVKISTLVAGLARTRDPSAISNHPRRAIREAPWTIWGVMPAAPKSSTQAAFCMKAQKPPCPISSAAVVMR
jgi:hypothetical protein